MRYVNALQYNKDVILKSLTQPNRLLRVTLHQNALLWTTKHIYTINSRRAGGGDRCCGMCRCCYWRRPDMANTAKDGTDEGRGCTNEGTDIAGAGRWLLMPAHTHTNNCLICALYDTVVKLQQSLWNRLLRRWSGSDLDLRFPLNASGVL